MRHYLLVDDNRALAENLAEIIRDTGDDVDVVEDGNAAVELVKKKKYDALLTDMRMPVMSGAELVHTIRRIDPGLPAMVVTAYSGDEDLRIARDEGLLCVLAKPVPIPRLLELLGCARRDGFVVVVEDDEALADNLGEVLRTMGVTAVTAHSMTETERLGNVKPFAAVVDLKVPGSPRGEAARRVAERFPGIPMFVITAHEEISPPVPPSAVFRKPFDTAALVRALELEFGKTKKA